MMKQDWIVSVYKIDRRCKAGERFIAKYPFSGMDRDAVGRHDHRCARTTGQFW
jgi:hypothetical protein